jgi:valyl-tRNA synthetase
MEAEKARLQKNMREVKANVDRLEARLNDQSFISKAPPARRPERARPPQ